MSFIFFLFPEFLKFGLHLKFEPKFFDIIFWDLKYSPNNKVESDFYALISCHRGTVKYFLF